MLVCCSHSLSFLAGLILGAFHFYAKAGLVSIQTLFGHLKIRVLSPYVLLSVAVFNDEGGWLLEQFGSGLGRVFEVFLVDYALGWLGLKLGFLFGLDVVLLA